MTPTQVLIIVLALALSAVIALNTISILVRPLNKGFLGLDLAYEILDALENRRVVLPVKVYVEAVDVMLTIHLGEGARSLNCSRILVLYRASNAPVINGSGGLWSLWSNGTHAGLIAGVEAVDKGDVIEVSCIRAGFKGYARSLRIVEDTLGMSVATENGRILFNGEEVLRWRGYRFIRIRMLMLRR